MKLVSNNHQATTLFELLGSDENDISKSIVWMLFKSPNFLKNFVSTLLSRKGLQIDDIDYGCTELHFQNHISSTEDTETGFSDIEIVNETKFRLIIEVKAGWKLPTREQLEFYFMNRARDEIPTDRVLVFTMSNCSAEYATHYQERSDQFDITHIPFEEVVEVLDYTIPRVGSIERRNLLELKKYLRKVAITRMSKKFEVKVVPLSTRNFQNTNISGIEVYERYGRYFHPIGGQGYSRVPLDYVAFRYNGRLIGVHKVISYRVIQNFNECVPDTPIDLFTAHYCYELGPRFLPDHEVRTKNRGQNFYTKTSHKTEIDLLFTCETIADAVEQYTARNNDELD